MLGSRINRNANNRSAVYKAYKQVDIDGYMCWACDCDLKRSDGQKCGIVPSSTNNTTNMWSHLRVHHAEIFTSLQRHGVLPSEIQIIGGYSTKPDDVPQNLRPKFSIKAKSHADRLATEWICDAHMSLHACENKRHREYASYISGGGFKAPCYRTVKNHTTMLATDGRQDSKSFCQSLSKDGIKPAGSTDPWSDNGCGLLGSTLHGIARQPPSILVSTPDPTMPTSTWDLQVHPGGAKPFGKEHHTADVIKAHYNDSMADVGVEDPVEDVFANVIDGASNMQAALSDRLSLWCNVHKLQRSVELFRSYHSILPILSKCRGVVGYFNHSTIGKNQLKVYQQEAGLNPHNLTQDVVTRWSSMHDMLDDLRVNREPLMVFDIRAKNPGDVYGANKLRVDDYSVVDGMIIVLQAARDATQLLQGDHYVTSSLVVPTLFKVMYYADPSSRLPIPWSSSGAAISHSQLPIEVQEAREEYSRDLNRRFREEIDDPTYYFWFNCCLLDPRFKSLKDILGLSSIAKSEARASFDSLYRMHWAPEMLELPDDDLQPEISAPIDATPTRNEMAVCGKRATVDLVSFLSPVDKEAATEGQPESAGTQDELQLYFSLPDASLCTDPLKWWPMHEKLLPNLSRMARQFLGVPASSASVERMFSGVGKDFCKSRQAMTEETLEELTWARAHIKRKYK